MNYDDLENISKNTKKRILEPTPFQELCYLTFHQNKDGKRLLEYMIEDTLNSSFQTNMSETRLFIEIGKQELIKSFRKAVEHYNQLKETVK